MGNDSQTKIILIKKINEQISLFRFLAADPFIRWFWWFDFFFFFQFSYLDEARGFSPPLHLAWYMMFLLNGEGIQYHLLEVISGHWEFFCLRTFAIKTKQTLRLLMKSFFHSHILLNPLQTKMKWRKVRKDIVFFVIYFVCHSKGEGKEMKPSRKMVKNMNRQFTVHKKPKWLISVWKQLIHTSNQGNEKPDKKLFWHYQGLAKLWRNRKTQTLEGI